MDDGGAIQHGESFKQSSFSALRHSERLAVNGALGLACGNIPVLLRGIGLRLRSVVLLCVAAPTSPRQRAQSIRLGQVCIMAQHLRRLEPSR